MHPDSLLERYLLVTNPKLMHSGAFFETSFEGLSEALDTMGYPISLKRDIGKIYFADAYPEATWPHQCFYFLVKLDKSILEINHYLPPSKLCLRRQLKISKFPLDSCFSKNIARYWLTLLLLMLVFILTLNDLIKLEKENYYPILISSSK